MIPLFSKNIVASLNIAMASDIDEFTKRNIKPRMVAVVSSPDPSALSYVASKQKAAAKVGITIDVCDISALENIDQAISKIDELCSDKNVHGVLVELPVKTGWDAFTLINAISPEKDVDGLSAYNLGILLQGSPDNGFSKPATPEACILLAQSVSPIIGKNIVVVGRGKTVGKPLANILINLGATTTVCNSQTVNLDSFTKASDIVFLATGIGHKFNHTYFRDGQIIIDAGISLKNGRMVGDADVDDLKTFDISLTPVPGGVGPLTSALILRNLLNLIRKTNG
jgi:methylenetetrahydrofolate dehydrogenase (NADP+) / methenyltetrahydrofolate cyclohydrolase